MHTKEEVIKNYMERKGCEYLKLINDNGDVIYTNGVKFSGHYSIGSVDIDKDGRINYVKHFGKVDVECADEKEVLGSSVKKWEKIINKLEDGEYTDILGTCGFCLVFGEESKYGDITCNNCPLYKEKYCSNRREDGVLLWEIYEDIRFDKYDDALGKSREMLMKIKEVAEGSDENMEFIKFARKIWEQEGGIWKVAYEDIRDYGGYEYAKSVAENGCESGICERLFYTDDIIEFFDEWEEEIEEMMYFEFGYRKIGNAICDMCSDCETMADIKTVLAWAVYSYMMALIVNRWIEANKKEVV